MTIGERIKYFREKQNITQNKLAELSGIHPVSIRKYETNKMIPQDPQIEKIAEALNINTIALTGVDIPKMHFDTVGDVMGVLMLLLSTDILKMTWNNLPNGRVNLKTVEIKSHSIFSSFIELVPTSNTNDKKHLNDFITQITHQPMIGDLVAWYQNRNDYYELLSRATDEDMKNPDSELNRCKALKESQENWLQSDRLSFEEMLKNGLEIHAAEKDVILNNAKK